MTPEMVERALRHAEHGNNGEPFTNVEFHLAKIDELPLADNSVDCVISNCVINLAPDKGAVFKEIVRVLKPGGRVAVSDIALKRELPEEIANDIAAYTGCIAGAIPIADYKRGVLEAGFSQVEIVDSASDLNAYAKLENQSGCCSPPAENASVATAAAATPLSCCGSEPVVEAASSCCSPSELKDGLSELLGRYNVNDYAASVKVYAIK